MQRFVLAPRAIAIGQDGLKQVFVGSVGLWPVHIDWTGFQDAGYSERMGDYPTADVHPKRSAEIGDRATEYLGSIE